MNLFGDEEEPTIAEARAYLCSIFRGATIRKESASGKVHTARHRPWAEMLGPGPPGQTCGTCHYLVELHVSKKFFKCGRQLITRGPGTDIRQKDPACRLWHRPGVPMFTVKGDG